MSERCYSAGAGAAAHVTYATQKLRIRKGCVREPGEQRPDLHSHQGLASTSRTSVSSSAQLCGNVDPADDLMEDALLRAMATIDSSQRGTNMPAWLFTILRNLFRSECRKRRREVEDTDGTYADSLKSHPEQHSRLEFDEFRAALAKLPPHQREALILVGASGFSCEEAAAICDCAVGTIKSRVHRARIRLSKLLSINGADDHGPDHTTRGILSAGGRS